MVLFGISGVAILSLLIVIVLLLSERYWKSLFDETHNFWDNIYDFISSELDATIIHGPEDGSQFAPGYYSILFEDPDGIRVEFNHVPGRGHLGPEGRLGENGQGPADLYGDSGLTNTWYLQANIRS